MNVKEFLARPHVWEWSGRVADLRIDLTDKKKREPMHADCTIFPANWCWARTGIDPARALRGTYSTAAEAKAIVAGFGGIAVLGAAMLEPHGFRRVQTPIDGDIGIVSAVLGTDPENCVDGLIPGICFGPLWVVMSMRGPQAKKLASTGIAWRIA